MTNKNIDVYGKNETPLTEKEKQELWEIAQLLNGADAKPKKAKRKPKKQGG